MAKIRVVDQSRLHFHIIVARMNRRALKNAAINLEIFESNANLRQLAITYGQYEFHRFH